MSSSLRRLDAALLLVLVLAGLGLRGIHLDWGLPEVFEEATPAREAVEMWGAPGESIDLNPGFFKYPSLTLYLNFLVQGGRYLALSLGGDVESLNDYRQLLGEDLGRAVLYARWLQALIGALLAVPVFFLGRRVGGPVAGWGAALLAVVLPAAVGESQLVGPDVALTTFAAAALAVTARLSRTGDRRDYLWAGLWIGLAASSKYPGALLAVALLVAHAQVTARRGEGPAGVLLSGLLWQSIFVAALAFVATSPYVLLDPTASLADLGFERRHMALGHLGREGGRAGLYYVRQVLPDGWSWPVLIAALAGVVALIARRASRGAALPGVIFAAVMLGILGSWKTAAPRYLLPLAPLGAVWAASAVALLASRLPRRVAIPSGLVLAVLLAAWPLKLSFSEVLFRGRVDSRTASQEWIEANVPEGSSILVERYGPEPDPGRYVVVYLPFHGILPHIYDPAYSPVLYSTFDYVVFSSGVYDRYLAHPREYPAQAAFYAGMERGFQRRVTFSAGTYLGPTVRILQRNPEWQVPDFSALPDSFFAGLEGNGPLAEYYSKLGTAVVRQGHGELGFRLLRAAVEMDGASPLVWGNLGVMELRAGRFQEALAALREAARLDPGNARVQYNLGLLFSRDGEFSQAADAYRRATLLDASFEDAWLGLARTLVEDLRYNEARAVLVEFLDRFPRSPRREAAQTALRELAPLGPGRP